MLANYIKHIVGGRNFFFFLPKCWRTMQVSALHISINSMHIFFSLYFKLFQSRLRHPVFHERTSSFGTRDLPTKYMHSSWKWRGQQPIWRVQENSIVILNYRWIEMNQDKKQFGFSSWWYNKYYSVRDRHTLFGTKVIIKQTNLDHIYISKLLWSM